MCLLPFCGDRLCEAAEKDSVVKVLLSVLEEKKLAREPVKVIDWAPAATQPATRPASVFKVDAGLFRLNVPTPVDSVQFNIRPKLGHVTLDCIGDWGQEEIKVMEPAESEKPPEAPAVRPVVELRLGGKKAFVRLRPGTTGLSLAGDEGAMRVDTFGYERKGASFNAMIMYADKNGSSFGENLEPSDSRRIQLRIRDNEWPYDDFSRQLVQSGLTPEQTAALLADAKRELEKSTDEELCRLMLNTGTADVLNAANPETAMQKAICLTLTPSPHMKECHRFHSEERTLYLIQPREWHSRKHRIKRYYCYAFDKSGKAEWGVALITVQVDQMDHEQLMVDMAVLAGAVK